jgi:hypothetical protein
MRALHATSLGQSRTHGAAQQRITLPAGPRRCSSGGATRRGRSSSGRSGGGFERPPPPQLCTARAAAGDIGDAYENLFRSKIFQSEIAVREFDT